jgi:hypothetical protein
MSLLMGALGGLGRGMAEVGTSMMKEEAQARRDANMERIANKQYDRGRTDQLDDVRTSQEYQAGLTKDQRELDATDKLADRKLFEEDRASTLSNQKELETFRAGLTPSEAKLNPLLAKFLDADAKIRGSFKEGGDYANLNKLIKANRDQYGALGLDLGSLPEDQGMFDVQELADIDAAKEAADKKIVDDRNAEIDAEQEAINDKNKQSSVEDYIANGGDANDLQSMPSRIGSTLATPFNYAGGLLSDRSKSLNDAESGIALSLWRSGKKTKGNAEQIVDNPQATLEERQQAQRYLNATK